MFGVLGHDQEHAHRPGAADDHHGVLRAAGLSFLLLCCAAMVVAVRDPAPGPTVFFVIAMFVGAFRGLDSFALAAATLALILWPLWVLLWGQRGRCYAFLAVQILLHLGIVGLMFWRTGPGQRDAVLLTSLPLAMAVTFTVYDVLLTLEGGHERSDTSPLTNGVRPK